jgi:hypothetical protein
MSSALQATRHELDQVRDALIELYLDVKVRPTDDVRSAPNEDYVALKTGRHEPGGGEAVAIPVEPEGPGGLRAHLDRDPALHEAGEAAHQADREEHQPVPRTAAEAPPRYPPNNVYPFFFL